MEQRHKTDYIKICEMVNLITKIDVQLKGHDGNTIFKIVNHQVPIIYEHIDKDFIQINNNLKNLSSNQFYHYIHPYGLEYIACGLWENQTFIGCILVGPFVSNTSILDLIKDIIYKNNLPISERKNLESFYQALPALHEAEYQNIGEMIMNLSSHKLMRTKSITSGKVKHIFNQKQLRFNIEENKQKIEERYELQNQIIDAIARGDKEQVNRLIKDSQIILEFSERIPGSPIRSSKNIAFTTNTLFRIAAERSGVHPVYLHNISERFAILIERTTTLPKLKKLIVIMANEYCDLVRTHSTGKYSPDIKKAIDYILFNLGESLSLNTIANYIPINPAHLSRKFRKETGITITDYINRKRVDEAKFYLQRGKISITDVAFMVGFNDVNYFTKVFKKYTSITPSQFMKSRFFTSLQ